MNVVDDAVLILLRSYLGGEQHVHDGQLIPPRLPGAPPVKVTYPLPLAIYFSNVGIDDTESRRLGARRSVRSVFWSITYVGRNRAQAKAYGERIHTILERRRLVVVGYPNTGVVSGDVSQRVRRDDDVMDPDGKPLYYGISEFSMPLYSGAIPAMPTPLPIP